MIEAERLGKGKSAALLVLSIIMMIAASEILIIGATDLISQFARFQTLVGMTVVAVALSTGEVARTVLAALREHGEISADNVLGSVLAFFSSQCQRDRLEPHPLAITLGRRTPHPDLHRLRRRWMRTLRATFAT